MKAHIKDRVKYPKVILEYEKRIKGEYKGMLKLLLKDVTNVCVKFVKSK